MPVDRFGTGVARSPQGVLAYGSRGVRGCRFDGQLDVSLLGSAYCAGPLTLSSPQFARLFTPCV